MSKSKSKSSKNDFAVEEVLQAIVIADSYDVRFAPISEVLPRCLFPFAGATILDYTLTNLHHHGIEEVIIYCTAHASKIREHVENNWSQRLKIITIASDTASSVGDAMRDLDSKDLIRSDFILLHGDLVTNVNMRKLLFEHKRIREKHKSCIMTLVCKRAQPGGANLSFLYDPDTKQILNFACNADKRQRVRISKKKMRNPKSTIFYVENGFRNTDIAVCSVNVPMFMTENFDFPGIINVVKGCMVNVDIHGYSVHFHELSDTEETYRVRDMMMYSKLNFHVLHGLIEPFMPCKVSGMPYFLLDGRRSFIHANAKLPPFCRLGNAVLIGEDTTIGEDCSLNRCLIGRNCKIGNNVRLHDCFIWNDVVVEANCVVDESILCSNVHLKSNSEIRERSVLCFDVVVGPSARLNAEILVSKEQSKRLDLKGHFGAESLAYRYSRKSQMSTTDDSDFGDMSLDVDYQKIWMHDDDDSVRENLPDDDDELFGSSDGGFDEEEDDYEEAFSRELKETLDRCTKERISTENIVLDINSLKHTYYIHIDVLHSLLTKCVLEYPILTEECHDVKTYTASILKLLKTILPVFKYYIKDEDSSMCVLQSLEDTAAEHSVLLAACPKVLYHLYDNDILKEEVILKWFDNVPAKEIEAWKGGEGSDEEEEEEDDEDKKLDEEDESEEGDDAAAERVRNAVRPFVEWLRSAEEESGSD